MIPSIGRTVHYRLSDQDAREINKRRQDALASRISATNSGAVVHHGNGVRGGDVFPFVITRVWAEEPTETTPVNGQVLLDGNDTLWATSRQQGDAYGQWFAPPSVTRLA